MRSKVITNRNRAKQLLAFDGMQYGLCRPTDLDFSMDFGGKVFIIVELKGPKVPLTRGQKLHLEFMCNAIEDGGRKAFAIVAEHDTPDTSHDVCVADSIVTGVYMSKVWDYTNSGRTVDEVIKAIHEEYTK